MAANVLSFGGLAPFVVTRQVVGGAALEEMRLDERPAVFTVAGHAVEPRPAAARRAPRTWSTSPPEVRRGRPGRPGGLDRGAGTGPVRRPEVRPGRRRRRPRCRQRRTASATCSSSPTCSAARWASPGWSPASGWRPHHEQVGQTGSRISPELYIPCGISGAIQHWAGCSSAKNILAINTDADAPMVTKATYAVIGDLHEVVPAINAEIRRRTGG